MHETAKIFLYDGMMQPQKTLSQSYEYFKWLQKKEREQADGEQIYRM